MNNVLSQVGWESQVKTALSSEANNSWQWYYVSGWQNSLLNALIGHRILIGCRHSV